MKIPLLFLICFTSQQALAIDAVEANNSLFREPCDILSPQNRIEQLAKFKRVEGTYRVDDTKLIWFDLAKYGWPRIIIPGYNYASPTVIESPFKVKELEFVDRDSNVEVLVTTLRTKSRVRLYLAAKPEVFKKYKDKNLFLFLEEGLGIYVDRFNCDGTNIDRSISMFMSSVLLPINNSLTLVYQLTKPRALLLVQENMNERKNLQLIFQDNKDVDALSVVYMTAPKIRIQDVLSAIKENQPD